jgi:transglutaminase-like putative cysteine protease
MRIASLTKSAPSLLSPLLAAPLLLVSLLSGPAEAQNNAPARIRLRTEDLVMKPDGTAVATLHVELQILNQSVVSQLMQQRIGYDGTLQDIAVTEAYTVKPGGQKIPVDPSTILTQQAPAANPLAPVYTDQRQKVVIFPQVEAGDTLSFTYTRTEKQPMWPNQALLAENYGPAPVDEARITVKAPKAMALNLDVNGIEVKKTEDGDQAVYSWSYSHPIFDSVPPAMVSDPRAQPHVYLSSFKTYDDFSHSYAAMIADKVAVTARIQQQADQLTAGITDKRAQAQAIYAWVAQRVRYVAIAFGTGGIIPHDPEWVLNNLYGDCKDHAVLFASLLKAKGIAADLVLLNGTNDYGLPKVPISSPFNHMIVWLPDFKLYADTTSNVDAFGTLPLPEYGKPVVHVVARGPAAAQIPLVAAKDLTIAYKVTETVDPDGRLEVSAVTTGTGPMAATLRRAAAAIQAQGVDKFAGDRLSKAGMPRATGSLSIPPAALTGEYQLSGSFKTGGAVANQFFLSALNALRLEAAPGDFLMGPLNGMQANLKLPDDAATPCYSGKSTEDVSLTMLPGMQMAAIPDDVSIKTAHLQYSTHWTHAGPAITLHREFVSSMDQPVCSGATRKETADALARIRTDFETRLTLLPGAPGGTPGGASGGASGNPAPAQ